MFQQRHGTVAVHFFNILVAGCGLGLAWDAHAPNYLYSKHRRAPLLKRKRERRGSVESVPTAKGSFSHHTQDTAQSTGGVPPDPHGLVNSIQLALFPQPVLWWRSPEPAS